MAHKAYITGFQPERYYPSAPPAFKDAQDEAGALEFLTPLQGAAYE